MELLLASDVIYAERVAPLIEQALASAGITGQTVASSAFLPDVSWLVPQTVARADPRLRPDVARRRTRSPARSRP